MLERSDELLDRTKGIAELEQHNNQQYHGVAADAARNLLRDEIDKPGRQTVSIMCAAGTAGTQQETVDLTGTYRLQRPT